MRSKLGAAGRRTRPAAVRSSRVMGDYSTATEAGARARDSAGSHASSSVARGSTSAASTGQRGSRRGRAISAGRTRAGVDGARRGFAALQVLRRRIRSTACLHEQQHA